MLAAWLMMLFGGEGTLSSRGLGSLKYFTTLSNLLEGAASVWWLIAALRSGTRLAERLKFVAAAAVMLTFTVVMTFLGPLYGYRYMFGGANLWFHLLVPLMAAAEFILLGDGTMTRRDDLLAVLPPLLYGAVYLCNILVNGVGEYPHTNDWYGFVLWGLPVSIVIFAVICGVTYLLALMLRKLSTAAQKREKPADR